jgi:hypothetical protein
VMRNRLRKISELSSQQTEEIVCFLDSNHGTVFHEPDFNCIVSEVFKTQFSYQLVYNNDGELIALCPLHCVRDRCLSKTYSNPAIYGVPYGGWIYDRNAISLRKLIDQLNLSLNESLTYWSIPQIENNDYLPIENKIEFQTGIIDLTLSLDDILYKCVSRKKRETIRSASRKGVVVEQLSITNLDLFIEQCNFLKSSVGLRPFPNDYFAKLFECYYGQNKMAVFMSKLDNDYLASGMIIGNKNMTHLWIAGKPRKIPKGVPRQDLLIWEAVKWAKEKNCRYFDLCVVESKRLPDIARHKLGFSKSIVPFYLYTKRRFISIILSRIHKIYDAVHLA